MTQFKAKDKVVILADAKMAPSKALGKSGVIVGPPSAMPGVRKVLVDGKIETSTTMRYWYEVRLDESQQVVKLEESDLVPG